MGNASPSGADIDTSTEIFNDLNLNWDVPCSYTDCDIEATHFLVCPEDGMRETMCTPHTIVTKLMQVEAPDETIVFDNSCGHHPKAKDCKITPMGKK